jgi:hypothetical protein
VPQHQKGKDHRFAVVWSSRCFHEPREIQRRLQPSEDPFRTLGSPYAIAGRTVNCEDGLLEETFVRLQQLEQGKFQLLGDELLPWSFPQLVGLEPFGLNAEGKTRKGVPDSFVGSDPKTCRAAVEYTTQATNLDGENGKLAGDYSSVRQSCSAATTIFLCTNRPIEGLDLEFLQARAAADGVALRIVGGRTVSRLLCDRQDLRKRFLRIPIGAHSLTSLIEELRVRLPELLAGHVPSGDLQACIARPRTDHALWKRISTGRAGATLVVAPAGLGKTTWSALDAYRNSGAQPTIWIAASDLPLASPDPLQVAIVHAAYGVSDPARATELAELLRRERGTVRLYLDGLDEAQDYTAIARSIRVFRAGVLSQHTHLVMLARNGAEDALRESLGKIQPELFDRDSKAKIALEPFSREEIAMHLARQGASPADIRHVEAELPLELQGNPLFARRCLDLVRAGTHAFKTGTDTIGAICEHFVKDISQRLSANGVSPSPQTVRGFLEKLALAALRSGNNTISPAIIAAIPGGDVEGENTLIGRAIQTGLLARRENDAPLRFTHALFLEYFAAKGLERVGQAHWEDHLPSLATAAGRQVAARIGAFILQPTPLAAALLDVDGIAACELVANSKGPIDADVLERLLSVIKKLITSRFPSDRARAIRLLGGFGPENRKAVEFAASWWNGLPGQERRHWLDEWADLFLKLHVSSAAELIMHHRAFLWPSGMPWYEPGFVQLVQSLPGSFQTDLREHARRRLEGTPSASEQSAHQCIMLLAILRDSWLVDHLQARMASEKMLDSESHRALIFLNTTESIGVFTESVDIHLEALRAIDASTEVAPRTDALESNRNALWEQIVLSTADIAMYPHDKLLDVVEASLESNRRDHIAFGHRWAEYLRSPRLLGPHAVALARYPQSMMALTTSMARRLLGGLAFRQIQELYEGHGPLVRQQIVQHLHEVPGPDVEAFLIQRMEEPKYRFGAIQSLGLLRAVRAGPAIQHWLEGAEAHIKHAAVEALGRLRHAPARSELVHELRSLLSGPQAVRDADLEFCLIRAIGKIGGADGYSALEWVFPLSRYPQRVIEALFRKRDPEAIESANRILSVHHHARSMVVHAITAVDPDDVQRVGEIPTAWLKDATILDLVLAEAKECVSNGSMDWLHNPIAAVAAFDLDQAHEFLLETASRTPIPHEGKKRREVDPIMEARLILGRRGHVQYSRMAIDDELSRVEEARTVGTWQLRRLQSWPRAQVRDALLARLRDSNPSTHLLWMFQWFAEAEDRVLFEALEKSTDLAVADLAHSILSRPLG